jgi:hypothetical protein
MHRQAIAAVGQNNQGTTTSRAAAAHLHNLISRTAACLRLSLAAHRSAGGERQERGNGVSSADEGVADYLGIDWRGAVAARGSEAAHRRRPTRPCPYSSSTGSMWTSRTSPTRARCALLARSPRSARVEHARVEHAHTPPPPSLQLDLMAKVIEALQGVSSQEGRTPYCPLPTAPALGHCSPAGQRSPGRPAAPRMPPTPTAHGPSGRLSPNDSSHARAGQQRAAGEPDGHGQDAVHAVRHAGVAQLAKDQPRQHRRAGRALQ